MERRQRVRKSVALVGAVLLVGAFVFYRAGFGGSSMSNSKSTFIFVGSSIRSPEAPPRVEDNTPATPPMPAPVKPGE